MQMWVTRTSAWPSKKSLGTFTPHEMQNMAGQRNQTLLMFSTARAPQIAQIQLQSRMKTTARIMNQQLLVRLKPIARYPRQTLSHQSNEEEEEGAQAVQLGDPERIQPRQTSRLLPRGKQEGHKAPEEGAEEEGDCPEEEPRPFRHQRAKMRPTTLYLPMIYRVASKTAQPAMPSPTQKRPLTLLPVIFRARMAVTTSQTQRANAGVTPRMNVTKSQNADTTDGLCMGPNIPTPSA
eukprot:28618_3